MKNRFFDMDDLQEAVPPPASLFRSKYLLAHYQKLGNIKEELSRLPEKEEMMFLQTEKAFNAFTFIPAVVKLYKVRHLMAATYSINKRVIEALMELHDAGFIDKITLCISDSLIKRNPKTVDILTAYVKSRPNIKVLFAWTHAKVALLETDNAHYVIEGSGNWSENAHYEQYLFGNSRGLFEFRKELFENVNVKYVADHRGIRNT